MPELNYKSIIDHHCKCCDYGLQETCKEFGAKCVLIVAMRELVRKYESSKVIEKEKN